MNPESQPKKKFSYLFYNVVSYIGVIISLVVVAAEIFLFVMDMIDHGHNLYLGLFTYLLLPGVLIFGLLLIPIGVLWKKSRIKRGLPDIELRRIRIDLSLSHHRNTLLVFIVGTALLLLMTLVGAYKAFHYTESVEFCGLLCHHVMKPEHTAYLNSPHGRVKCVECHIGAGADWYLRSKLTGMRQVLRVVDGKYHRPIETPVKELRPAQDTCEKCHWPEKKFSTLDFKRKYFLTEGDEKEWQLRMLLNVGGGERGAYGVHSHMNVDHDIYYAAEDDQRQKITWVRSITKDGKETIYIAPGSKFKDQPPAPEKIRKMDCIDCHNRPTHRFNAPYRLVNEGMGSKHIEPSLPGIKEKALEVLSDEYATEPEALKAIPEKLKAFYAEKYPEVARDQAGAIDAATAYLNEVYSKNMFPEMKARWDVHPDNIGHLASPGCFRCHDGEHSAADGKKITHDCNACHMIIEQGPRGQVERDLDGLDFKHPVDDDNGWKEMNCTECHTGAGP